MATAQVILLADNIPDHRHAYAAALRARGYHAVLAGTGDAALGLAAAMPPACIVIDVRLPDMTGWELCRRFKNNPATAATPVVMLAQDLSRSSACASRDAGCAAWLARPTFPEDVVRAVEHVLSLGISEPPDADAARIGLRECPACASDKVRAGVRTGPVQYYGCGGCGVWWRVSAEGAATA